MEIVSLNSLLILDLLLNKCLLVNECGSTWKIQLQVMVAGRRLGWAASLSLLQKSIYGSLIHLEVPGQLGLL